MTDPYQSVIRLCGELFVEVAEERVDQRIPPGQASLLFAFLVANRGGVVNRHEAIDALWRDRVPQDPQAVLSTLLSRLRRAAPAIGIEGRSSLRVALPEPVWVDVEVVRSAVDAAATAQEASDPATASRHAREALAVASGRFLPGHDAEWVVGMREQLDERLATAYECIARSAIAGDGANPKEGARAARVVIDRRPFHESGYRLLMEVLEASGDVAEALRVYDELRRILRDELGTAPAESVQAVHRRLLQGGGPLRPASRPPSTGNLPGSRGSFLGRDRELHDLGELVVGHRAVTIVGAGGMGKTRLAVEVATRFEPAPRDGSWFVDLAAIDDPELVPAALASALRLRDEPGEEIPDTLARHLSEADLWVVLDNCEHLTAAARDLATLLVQSCPGVRLIATSRERLDFQGEQVWKIGPLERAAGTELFVARATAVAADFHPGPEGAGAVADICRRLDGMPLAIELAAALVGEMGTSEIGERLDRRLRLTMEAGGGAVDRHRTLAALVAWSYELLDDAEQAVLRRLAVFQGGMTLPAVEEVCTGPGVEAEEVLDLVRPLVQKSLVTKEEHAGRARYRMLETIRQFAERALDESGEIADVRAAHLRHFCDVAERTESLLGPSKDEEVAALDQLEADLDNIRAALRFGLLGGPAENAAALALGASLFQLWYVRGHMSEGRRWLDALASACAGQVSEARSKALSASGELAREQGDYDTARERLTEGLQLAQELGIAGGYGGAAFALFNLGAAEWEQGNYAEAHKLIEESLAALEDGESRAERGTFTAAWPLLKLGQVALDQGETDRARAWLEQSLELHRRQGGREGIARSLDALARVVLAEGDAAASRLLSERSLDAANQLGYKEGLPAPLQNLGRLALLAGDDEAALEHNLRALEVCVEIGSKRGQAASIEGLACVEEAREHGARALELFGGAAAIRDVVGSPIAGHLRAEIERAIDSARDRAGAHVAAAAWHAGYSMTRDEAVAFARSG